MTRARQLAWVGAALVAVALATSMGNSRRPRVAMVHPSVQQVVQSVSAAAQVAGRDESDVGAEVAGRLATLEVREGQRVARGQILARLDDRLLRTQVEQARAALRTAQETLRQASRPALASEVALAEAETAENEASARAQRHNASQRWLELRHGPTREEREQARAQVRSAAAERDQAERESARTLLLAQQGFVTVQELERAQTAARSARASYAANRERLRQLEIGTRREVMQQAQAQLQQADVVARGAAAVRAARLRTLADQPRPEDVAVAQARLEEARCNVRVAEERLRQCEVRAPYAGLVGRLLLKPGQNTAAASPILHLIRLPGLELQMDVDENNLHLLQVGQEAVVSSDAFPDTFPARLREIAPQVVSARGTVQLKLDPKPAPSWLKPGQTVSVNVLIDRGSKRPVLPLSCVRTAGRRSTVLVVEQGRLREQAVELGAAGATGYPILQGVQESDWVVLEPSALQPGQAVRGEPR